MLLFVRKLIFCCMQENQRIDAEEWERRSNCRSVPPHAGELTDLLFRGCGGLGGGGAPIFFYSPEGSDFANLLQVMLFEWFLNSPCWIRISRTMSICYVWTSHIIHIVCLAESPIFTIRKYKDCDILVCCLATRWCIKQNSVTQKPGGRAEN